jgi:hypothetical protein
MGDVSFASVPSAGGELCECSEFKPGLSDCWEVPSAELEQVELEIEMMETARLDPGNAVA